MSLSCFNTGSLKRKEREETYLIPTKLEPNETVNFDHAELDMTRLGFLYHHGDWR